MNFFNKTKLAGEILLLERESANRKRAFGIELYNLLTREGQIVGGGKPNSMFHSTEHAIHEPYTRAVEDIQVLQDEVHAKEDALDAVVADKARGRPAISAQEKVENAGKWLSNSGAEGKIRVQLTMVNRKIEARKQEFGMEVFDLVEPSGSEAKKGLGAAIANQLSKLSNAERAIQECIDGAKRDVEDIEGKKASKEREKALLEQQ